MYSPTSQAHTRTTQGLDLKTPRLDLSSTEPSVELHDRVSAVGSWILNFTLMPPGALPPSILANRGSPRAHVGEGRYGFHDLVSSTLILIPALFGVCPGRWRARIVASMVAGARVG